LNLESVTLSSESSKRIEGLNLELKKMKQRILSNWNFTRFFFTGMGIALIISSIQEFEWMGMIAGGYFASMGIFAFGCASGNCYGGSCRKT
jgi:hypothetical protein